MKNFLFAFTAFIGLAFASLATAGVTEVKRFSTKVGNVFVPALLISVDGDTTIIPLGAEGLTRSIIFSDKLAVAYASSYTGKDVTASHNHATKWYDPVTKELLKDSDHSW